MAHCLERGSRLSTTDQDLALQLDALKAAGCECIYEEISVAAVAEVWGFPVPPFICISRRPGSDLRRTHERRCALPDRCRAEHGAVLPAGCAARPVRQLELHSGISSHRASRCRGDCRLGAPAAGEGVAGYLTDIKLTHRKAAYSTDTQVYHPSRFGELLLSSLFHQYPQRAHQDVVSERHQPKKYRSRHLEQLRLRE